MGSNGKFRGLLVLRLPALAGLALSLLITPSVRAGHLVTSPAQDAEVADPGTVDGVAIRGTTNRSSTGPDDVPVGVAGRATGNAVGADVLVNAVRGDATGSATGVNSEVDAIRGQSTGDAVGNDSEVDAVTARSLGNASGPLSQVTGLRAVATGTPTGQGAGVVAIRARADGTPTGQNSVVAAVSASARATSGFALGVIGGTNSPDGQGVRGQNRATSGSGIGVLGESFSASGNPIGVLGQTPNATSGTPQGVVGLSSSPSGIGVHGISPGVAGQFDGRVQINCSTFPCVTINGFGFFDMAENLSVAARVTPGDVVVVAERKGGYGIAPASLPYDTRVAGIVSAHPPVLLQSRQREQAAPVAMVGIVRAKATAANGSIRVGDLLTTSGIPGHLMRCPTALRCVGAVVGKALEPLEKGEKQILVMLWRQ